VSPFACWLRVFLPTVILCSIMLCMLAGIFMDYDKERLYCASLTHLISWIKNAAAPMLFGGKRGVVDIVGLGGR
jgi:hypothetical protein